MYLTESSITYTIYSTEGLGGELRQGEIISGILRYIVDASSDPYEVTVVNYDYAIVATQDCDLLQDYERRNNGKEGSLCEVLVFPAEIAVNAWGNIQGSDLKKKIKNNKDERYHILQKAPSCLDLERAGTPTLLIDFKCFFTTPPEELHRQLIARTAMRRCRLEMPYREHLQTRAAFYFQRIMLPEAHQFNFESEKSELDIEASPCNVANTPSTGATQDAPEQPKP